MEGSTISDIINYSMRDKITHLFSYLAQTTHHAEGLLNPKVRAQKKGY
jgi:hypothetical protein